MEDEYPKHLIMKKFILSFFFLRFYSHRRWPFEKERSLTVAWIVLSWPYHILDRGMEDKWMHTQIPLLSSADLEPGIGATYPSPCGAVKVQSSLSLCPDVHSTGLVLWMVMLRYYGCSARAICNLPKERSCVLSGPGIRGATNLAFFFF